MTIWNEIIGSRPTSRNWNAFWAFEAPLYFIPHTRYRVSFHTCGMMAQNTQWNTCLPFLCSEKSNFRTWNAKPLLRRTRLRTSTVISSVARYASGQFWMKSKTSSATRLVHCSIKVTKLSDMTSATSQNDNWDQHKEDMSSLLTAWCENLLIGNISELVVNASRHSIQIPFGCIFWFLIHCQIDDIAGRSGRLTQSVCWWMEPEWWRSWTEERVEPAGSRCWCRGGPFSSGPAGVGPPGCAERYSEKPMRKDNKFISIQGKWSQCSKTGIASRNDGGGHIC